MSHSFVIAVATLMTLSTCPAVSAFAKDFKSTDDFTSQAAISSLFEIKTSELALTKSQDADVKAFAQQMITDHTKAAAAMKAAMTASQIDTSVLPTKLDDAHQKIYDTLHNLSNDKFDEEYMDVQNDAHKDAIALFKSYATDGDSTALKNFAANTLPTLEMHAKHVDQIDETVDD